ncbi:MAG: BatD family protein [Lewinellaceae bacterium]|nr:BatD family protein [Lewinellaceae bacterium]
MNKLIIIAWIMGSAWWAQAQEASFSVTLSADTIGLGDHLEVTFSLENARGSKFEAPEFEGFQVVGGPNTASQISIVNGEMTQVSSYTFFLEPLDIGQYYIQPAVILADGKPMETELKSVFVFPDGSAPQKKEAVPEKSAPSKKRPIIKM